MKYTQNFNLKKPDGTDNVLISDLNENMDVLDVEVGELKNGNVSIPDLETEDKTLKGAINEIGEKVTANKQALTEHSGQSVVSEDGAHNLRYHNDKLEYNNGAQWNEIETGSTIHYAEAISTNGADYTITLDGIAEYVDGMTITIKPNMTSTGVVRLNINGLGFNYALHGNSAVIQKDEIRAGGMYTFCYAASFSPPGGGNASRFIMQGSNTILEDSLTTASVSRAATANAVKMVNDKFTVQQPIKIALMAGWSDTALEQAFYWKDSFDIVYLTGALRRTSGAPSSAFTLPVGYRPSQNVTFNGVAGQGTITVQQSGVVFIGDTRLNNDISITLCFRGGN